MPDFNFGGQTPVPTVQTNPALLSLAAKDNSLGFVALQRTMQANAEVVRKRNEDIYRSELAPRVNDLMRTVKQRPIDSSLKYAGVVNGTLDETGNVTQATRDKLRDMLLSEGYPEDDAMESRITSMLSAREYRYLDKKDLQGIFEDGARRGLSNADIAQMIDIFHEGTEVGLEAAQRRAEGESLQFFGGARAPFSHSPDRVAIGDILRDRHAKASQIKPGADGPAFKVGSFIVTPEQAASAVKALSPAARKKLVTLRNVTREDLEADLVNMEITRHKDGSLTFEHGGRIPEGSSRADMIRALLEPSEDNKALQEILLNETTMQSTGNAPTARDREAATVVKNMGRDGVELPVSSPSAAFGSRDLNALFPGAAEAYGLTEGIPGINTGSVLSEDETYGYLQEVLLGPQGDAMGLPRNLESLNESMGLPPEYKPSSVHAGGSQ